MVDSLGVSLGLGLMVLRATELAASGLNGAAVAAEVESLRARICHVFTLDTLEYAHRGDRVSAVAAVASRLLDVKAVLHMDMAGEVVIGQIGPTIGTHTGPGCISIFLEGPEGRDKE